MEAKHTPGPWMTIIDELTNEHPIIKGYPEQKNIALVNSYNGYGNYEAIEAEANAKLIAAAPEMLEKLIQVEEHLSATNASLRGLRTRRLCEGVLSEREAKLTGNARFESQEEYNSVAERHSNENREENELLISVRQVIQKATE